MTVRVQLLGGAGAELERGRVAFLPDKRFQLLAYLAWAESWVGREQLGYLFWPDVPTEQARHNLRQLLRRVQGLGWVNGLEAERQRVRWPVASDLSAFREAVAAGDEEGALSHYRGPLLSGLDGDGASEFDSWLAFEREHLRSRWRTMVLNRVAGLERAGDHDQAAGWLHLLLEQDALDEEALCAYMRASARSGRPLAALHAYRSFAVRLADELDLEPSTATQQLERAIREGAPPAVAEAEAAPAPLPPAATSFVGRASELGEIARLLDRDDCRLLTILGTGGIGKTRLALEAARERSRDHRERVCFVPLEALVSADLIPGSIAEALGSSLQGKEPPLAQIARHLADRRTLIVLDNFEGLSDGVPLVSELLRACPGLKLIATSRERLDLAEEWLLPIEGMRYPADGPLAPDEALAFDAVQLFCRRSQQVDPRFAPDPENLPDLLAICRLVEGSPLAIELAASWVRVFPVAEIAAEIERNLDFIASTSRTGPERHHSLRATFEYSWNLLGASEREALSRLSVFLGGFTREAAAVVAETPYTVLAALVDKSLLRVLPGGRYDRHPLLHQYMREKLAQHPRQLARMRVRHATYFHRFLGRQWRELLSLQDGQGVRAIAEDFENIRLAWQLALERGRVAEVRETVPTLTFFFDAQLRHREGVDLFEQAVTLLRGDSSRHREALGSLLAGQAWCYLWLGRFDEALRLLPEALRLLPPTPGEWGVWLAWRTLGFIAFFTGDFAEAGRCWSEELAGIREAKRLAVEAELLSRLALIHAYLGELEVAARYRDEALALRPKLGRYPALSCLLYAGFCELTLGRPRAAHTLHQEAKQLALDLGDLRYLPHLSYGLGLCALELGSYPEALALCQEAFALAERNDDLLARSWALVALGRAHLALGQRERAGACVRLGLAAAQGLGFAPTVRYGATALAAVEAGEGGRASALERLRGVLEDPGSDYFVTSYARRVLAEVEAGRAPGR